MKLIGRYLHKNPITGIGEGLATPMGEPIQPTGMEYACPRPDCRGAFRLDMNEPDGVATCPCYGCKIEVKRIYGMPTLSLAQ